MNACAAHPWGTDAGLACTRTDVHTVGHVYESATGSDVPDRHQEQLEDP